MNQFDAIFRIFDRDGDNKISAAELALCVRNAGVELSAEDADSLVESAGADGSLDLEGFARLLEVVADGGDEEERDRDRRAAFEMYENQGEGCITTETLKWMLSQLGAPRDIDECRTMICRFDLNGDGLLSFEEFKMMMMMV